MVMHTIVHFVVFLLGQQSQKEFWDSYNKPAPEIVGVK